MNKNCLWLKERSKARRMKSKIFKNGILWWMRTLKELF